MGFKTVAVGVLASTLTLFAPGQGNSQIDLKKLLEPTVAAAGAGDKAKPSKTALENFTDFLLEQKKDRRWLPILELPAVGGKNLPLAEAAFAAITDPKSGMKLGATNLGKDKQFTPEEKVRISLFVYKIGLKIADAQEALGTEEGDKKAQKTRATAAPYNVNDDTGISPAIGVEVPLTALLPTMESPKKKD